MEIRIVGSSEGARWNEFVSSQPGAELGHRFEWRRVFEESYRKRCFYLAAVEGDEWLGVLPLVRLTGPLSPRRLVSMPYLDHAGVLSSRADVAGLLTERAITLSRQGGCRGIELRQLVSDGVGADDRATMVLELPGSEEALWKTFKPKVRNQVRKAEREGLRTELAGVDRLDEFYGVFARNMRDLGSPVHSRKFIRAIFRHFADSVRLFVTLDRSDRVVGGAIALVHGDTATVPWASSLREVFTKCPNHSLYAKILATFADSGAKRFDFGRSWKDSGTYRFKKQWGAQPVALSWRAFDANGTPEPARGFRPDEHRGIVDIWSRLPVRLTEVLGPLIRRQLSN